VRTSRHKFRACVASSSPRSSANPVWRLRGKGLLAVAVVSNGKHHVPGALLQTRPKQNFGNPFPCIAFAIHEAMYIALHNQTIFVVLLPSQNEWQIASNRTQAISPTSSVSPKYPRSVVRKYLEQQILPIFDACSLVQGLGHTFYRSWLRRKPLREFRMTCLYVLIVG
jgi:hypothetical protein